MGLLLRLGFIFFVRNVAQGQILESADQPRKSSIHVSALGKLSASRHPSPGNGHGHELMRRTHPDNSLSSSEAASFEELRNAPVQQLQDVQGQVAKVMGQRRFSFSDPVCGKTAQSFTIQDTLAAFSVEQAYWSRQGQFNPWWAVLTSEKKGTAIGKDEKLNFYKTGVGDVSQMLDAVKQHGVAKFLPDRSGTALDLGCGLGRMSNALAALGFQKTICVDQSLSFLQAAPREMGQLAGNGAVPQNILSKISFVQSSPCLLCSVPQGSVDFSHSVITLQHMKSMLQVAYIEQMCDVLKKGGYGFFQIPVKLYAESPQEHCNIKNESFVMAMHSTPEAEVVAHLKSRGCTVLASFPWNRIGSIGKDLAFAFQKQ